MGHGRAQRARRGLLAVLALLLVAGLVVGTVLVVRAVRADPAWGDTARSGGVVGGGEPAGTRRDPAQVGEGTLHWDTRQGGEVALSVDRAERIHGGSRDLRTGWEGPFPCQEYFLVAMTIRYTGAGSWRPAEHLTVLRMTGPFGTSEASAGTELLAAPLLVEGVTLEHGDTVTGTVVFTGRSGTDWSHHLVLGTDGGGWLHVEPIGETGTSTSC